MDIDWNLIYNWLEQHSGVSYNFDDDFREITGDVAFDSPVFWSTTIGLIFDQLDEALDIIDEHGYSLPDDMPSKDQLKRIFADACITNILTNVNHIKSSLNIPIEKISSVEDLNNQVNALKDFSRKKHSATSRMLMMTSWRTSSAFMLMIFPVCGKQFHRLLKH